MIMRRKIVAGNWKMNKSVREGVQLAKEIKGLLREGLPAGVDVVLAPPFTHLTEICKIVKGTEIGLGAQNCASEEKGAYTGEVSAEMLKSAGAKYVILGHSERRTYYGEDDVLVNRKIRLVLKNALTPVYCCGEVLAERQAGRHKEIIKKQISEGLFGLTPEEFVKVVIAYEPVWAIGTGVNATPDQAQETHYYIRQLINEKYGNSIGDITPVLYGGSCNAVNARDLFANPDVDGGLIGGASLKAEDFIRIIRSF
jgi:triosephosphate isomerase (TIM)